MNPFVQQIRTLYLELEQMGIIVAALRRQQGTGPEALPSSGPAPIDDDHLRAYA